MTEKTELHIEQEDISPIKKPLINRPKGGYCTPLQEALESDAALFECFKTSIETTIMDAYNTRDWSKNVPERQVIVDVAVIAATRFLNNFIKGDI